MEGHAEPLFSLAKLRFTSLLSVNHFPAFRQSYVVSCLPARHVYHDTYYALQLLPLLPCTQLLYSHPI